MTWRTVLSVVSWALLVIMPVTGVTVLAGMSGVFLRSSARLSEEPFRAIANLIQFVAPGIILTLLGVGIGAAGLVLASMDRRLSRLEEKA